MTKSDIGGLLVLVLLFPACAPVAPVKEHEVYGVYIATYSCGTERLTLNANGTYKQEVTIKGVRKTLEHEGYWSFDATDDYVALENGLLAVRSGELAKDYNVPFSGIVLHKVIRSSFTGRIELSSASMGINFTKVQ